MQTNDSLSTDKSVWTSSETDTEFHNKVIIFVFLYETHEWITFTKTFI